MNLINILTITHPENGKTVFFRFANSSWQAFGNWHVILKYLTPELITLHYFMTYTHNGSKDWQLINIFNNKVCHPINRGLGVKNYILSLQFAVMFCQNSIITNVVFNNLLFFSWFLKSIHIAWILGHKIFLLVSSNIP